MTRLKNAFKRVRVILDSTTTSNAIGIFAIVLAVSLRFLSDAFFSSVTTTIIAIIAMICLGLLGTLFILHVIIVLRRYIINVVHNITDYIINRLFERIALLGSYSWHVFEAEHLWVIGNTDGAVADYSKTIRGYCSTAGAATYEEKYITQGEIPALNSCGFSNGEIIAIRDLGEENGIKSFKIVALLSDVYKYGQQFEFILTRRIVNAFTEDQEWVSTRILPSMHGKVTMRVRFPHGTRLLGDRITLEHDSPTIRTPEKRSLSHGFFADADGISCPEIVVQLDGCTPGDNYTIRWEWRRDGEEPLVAATP